ncbi:MAG TPA: D-glycero-beta-D-manno-heptose-7-phosphate kinase [Planctomycetota bacterium]|nr:D-glycero-beta-D-manno-heptose-7-phosphate kinase [Planctomycetota bacterium]
MSDTSELLAALERLGTPRVLIVGDLILDSYVRGEVERISPEAPIPVLAARYTDERLGGAGNVAANLRAMEAEVELVAVLGDDERAVRLRALLEAHGIDASGCVADAARPTTEKTRMVTGSQQILRVDWESSAPIDEGIARRVLAGLEARVRASQAVILSDYGKGMLGRAVLEGVIGLARAAGVPVLVDPKGNDYARYRGATLVTPNRKEAEDALGRRLRDLAELPRAAGDLIEQAGLDAAVITLGAEGIYHRTRDGEGRRVPTRARAVFDVTGAGDTVIAHLALGLAVGFSLDTAVEFANHAAGLVVAKLGAASVTRAELRAAFLAEGGHEGGGKVLERESLERALAAWRKQGKRVVFTNGCFDVLHAGHVQYLRFARSQGDVLLVGVNDDASVRALKGESRPINTLEDRQAVLAALECVDAVTSFSETTPAEIVRRVTPQVLVKGEDWATKGVVGREWVEQHGGSVVLAPLLAGRSTTSILERGAGTAQRPSC